MTERIATRQKLIHELEGELAQVHGKLAAATLKQGAEARRADQAESRLVAEAAKLEDAEHRAAEAIVLAAELEQEITDPQGRADRLGDLGLDAAAQARADACRNH